METTKNTDVATTSKRISAYLIDIFFIFILIGLISEIRFINPQYDQYTKAYENYNQIVEDYTNELITAEEFNDLYNENYYHVSKYSLSYNIVIIVVIILYFGVFQKYNNGQTIGKKLMKIRVVGNEESVGLMKYILRTLPIYFVYIGGILPVIINSVLVFILNENNYINISMIVSYIFLMISIISFVMIRFRQDRRGLHDLLANTKVIYEENKTHD